MIRGRFLTGFKGVTRNLARVRGCSPWNRRFQLGRRSRPNCSPGRPHFPARSELSCRHSQRKLFALPKGPLPTCLRPQTRVARRLSDNPQASTTFASATSKCPQMPAEASISNSATSIRHAYIPAWKVLAGEVSQEEIEGQIILIGTSAPGLLDLRATPVDAAVPGIDIHAQLLEHLLTGNFLERPDYALALEEFVILVLGIMLAFVLPRVSAKSLRSHWFPTIALVLMGGWAAFQILANVFLDPSYPALVLGFMTSRHHLLHVSNCRGTAQPDPQRLWPISCSRACRATGAIAGKARAGWRRARNDHPVQRCAGLYRQFPRSTRTTRKVSPR